MVITQNDTRNKFYIKIIKKFTGSLRKGFDSKPAKSPAQFDVLYSNFSPKKASSLSNLSRHPRSALFRGICRLYRNFVFHLQLVLDLLQRFIFRIRNEHPGEDGEGEAEHGQQPKRPINASEIAYYLV